MPLIVPGTAGLVGQVLGDRYRIQQELGAGGMGTVYLAEHVLMGRPCAVKVISPALTTDPEAVSRFNREATNASQITHPNVAAIYDFGLTPDGQVYLAMEYAEGSTLLEVLAEEGPLAPSRVASIVRQSAAGLQAAHDLGIVHRDLKPDNVMLVATKTGEMVKLVDFGIAKATGTGTRGEQEVTRSGMIVGTPEYMSPEQLAGDPVDGRSDLYSLAIVAYRMLTGSLPFAAESAQETMVKRLTDPPLSLEAALPGRRFPAGLQAVMDRALSRRPQDRFATVADFGESMTRAVASAEVAAREEPTVVIGKVTPIDVPPTRIAPRSGSRRSTSARAVLVVASAAVAASTAWAVWAQFGGPTGTEPRQPTAQPGAPPDTGAAGLARDTNVVTLPTRSSATRPPASVRGSDPGDVASLELPSLEAVTSTSPSVRQAVRTQLGRIYGADRAPDSLRAQAAYTMYLMALEDRQYPVSLEWIDRALRLQRREDWAQVARRLRQTMDSSHP